MTPEEKEFSRKESMRKYYRKNAEKIKANQRRYYLENRDRMREVCRQNKISEAKHRPWITLYDAARAQARQRGYLDQSIDRAAALAVYRAAWDAGVDKVVGYLVHPNDGGKFHHDNFIIVDRGSQQRYDVRKASKWHQENADK